MAGISDFSTAGLPRFFLPMFAAKLHFHRLNVRFAASMSFLMVVRPENTNNCSILQPWEATCILARKTQGAVAKDAKTTFRPVQLKFLCGLSTPSLGSQTIAAGDHVGSLISASSLSELVPLSQSSKTPQAGRVKVWLQPQHVPALQDTTWRSVAGTCDAKLWRRPGTHTHIYRVGKLCWAWPIQQQVRNIHVHFSAASGSVEIWLLLKLKLGGNAGTKQFYYPCIVLAATCRSIQLGLCLYLVRCGLALGRCQTPFKNRFGTCSPSIAVFQGWN